MLQSQQKRRKVTAILAGGLVLGVGAAITLAAWNDSEFATSSFTAGNFVFEGSVDGSDWGDHESSGDAAVLQFDMPLSTNLSPGDEVYAQYALRLDASTDATLESVQPSATGANALNFEFDARQTATLECDEASFTSGDPVATTIADGETINLCLRVTAGEDLIQDGDATVVWQWNAESQS